MITDISNERSNYVLPGVQHKYRNTIAVFVSVNCENPCDWCFRKRIFGTEALAEDKVADIDKTVEYIKQHKEIDTVLFTGGDALLADMDYLGEFTSRVAWLPNIKNIRFGTKALVVNPHLIAGLVRANWNQNLYLVLHIVMPSDLNFKWSGITRIHNGFTFLAQTPLLKNYNDNATMQAAIWNKLNKYGIQPYYTFHCRPVDSNKQYHMTLEEGFKVFNEAQRLCTGTDKRSRYVMSHSTGKLEIIGIEGDDAILKYHQARNPEDMGKIIRCNKRSIWLD